MPDAWLTWQRPHPGTYRVPEVPKPGEEEGGSSDDRFGELVGSSAGMRHVFGILREVSPTDLSVLVTGETGTGKELVAKAIHDHSPRREGCFVVVDCTTIVGTLAESLLFGHERNAFTGADKVLDGPFHEAHGGTIFLDEIGELPMDLQPKLLRALAERRVRRVGPRATYQDVDVRLIAATHKDLGRSIETGHFRADLYYRIAQIPLHLPPLRDRREDIPSIVRTVCARVGRPERAGEIIALAAGELAQRPWCGNVRELARLVEAIAVLPPGALTVAVLGDAIRHDAQVAVTSYVRAKRAAIEAFDQHYFRDLHDAARGNVSEMARISGLQRHHVRGHLKRLGIR